MGKRIVIALGGNALGNTPYEQLALVTETAKPIVDLIAQGNEVIIAHGNGPQVGMINLGMATAAEAKAIKSDMPFPECGAMSQGYIGYHLQNAIGNELASRGMAKDVATVVTQVLVDEADPAFQHPTKPVGAFYDKETADRIAAEKGYTMVEDAGRGYRQVVPSPKPIDVIEKNTVKALVDNGTVVITVGGGGIPVVRKDGKLYGYVTDGMGYTGELRRGGVEVAGKVITLLGAGGAASAIAIEAALEGAKEIRVFNKRDGFWERALANLKTIGDAAPACKITLSDLDDAEALRKSIDTSDILTNATRVGMAPMDDASLITDTSMFRPGLIVTDVVYNPEETKLLREAKAAGCTTFDGLGMLVGQGAASFKLYTGLEMPIDEVCDAIYR